MLSRQHRFHGLGSLRFVYRQGQTVRGPSLSLKYVLNSRRQTFRAGVVVSKRISKSAVVRNRLRRRAYEALRTQAAGLSQPYDLVLTVFDDQVAKLSPTELETTIADLLRRAKLLNKQITINNQKKQ